SPFRWRPASPAGPPFWHGPDFDHDHDEDDHADGGWTSPDSSGGVDFVDTIQLTTVGIDIGSSTSHLMFSRLHLQRLGQYLSSRYVVVNREVLHRSPILLTPYTADNNINAARLEEFIHRAYPESGLTRAQIDCGAI